MTSKGMTDKKKGLKKLKQNGLHRRLSVALTGVTSGARLLNAHAQTVFKDPQEKEERRSLALQQEALKFAERLGELKGAYVKIGQMMALYGDHLLPTEITRALRTLEDQTSAMEWSSIEPVLRHEFGGNYQKLEINPVPIAAASLSQAHTAVVKETGEQLCIKVQYPGVSGTIESDFSTVLGMLKLTRWVPNSHEFELWMQELKQQLIDEVDYVREAQMVAQVQSMTAPSANLIVPNVFPEFSTQRVLALSFIEGYSITSPQIGMLSLARRNALAKTILNHFFDEIFNWGLMQTDPNFGNYKIKLRAQQQEQDQLGLLDFGAVRPLPETFRQSLCATILAAHDQNRAQVIENAIALGCLHADQAESVKQSFAEFCILLMEPFRTDHSLTPAYALSKRGDYCWHQSRLLKRVGKLGAKAILIEGFSSPPKEFALIARKLTGVFSLVTTLRAEFDAAPLLDKFR